MTNFLSRIVALFVILSIHCDITRNSICIVMAESSISQGYRMLTQKSSNPVSLRRLMGATDSKHKENKILTAAIGLTLTLSQLKKYIAEGGNVNAKSSDGDSLLHYLVSANMYSIDAKANTKKLAIIEELLKSKDIDIHATSVGGYTPLMMADDIQVINLLKKHMGKEGMKIENQIQNAWKKKADLTRAAQWGNVDFIKKSLDKGDDINTQEPVEGKTLLMLAVQSLQYKVIEELLNRNDIDLNVKDKNGHTVLQYIQSPIVDPQIKKLFDKHKSSIKSDRVQSTKIKAKSERLANFFKAQSVDQNSKHYKTADDKESTSLFAKSIGDVTIEDVIKEINTKAVYQIEQSKYEIISELGGGTFGRVFLANKIMTDPPQQFAVKLQDVQEKNRWTIAIEEKIMALLIKKYNKKSAPSTNNLCTSYELSDLGDSFDDTKSKAIKTFAMVLPYFSDGDLEHHLGNLQNNGPLNERSALQQVSLFLEEVGVNGLQIINERLSDTPYYYYDLKPENILIELSTNADYVKKFILSDFGLVHSSISARGNKQYLNPYSIEMWDIEDMLNSDKINKVEQAELNKNYQSILDIIKINPSGVIDIYALAAAAFEFYAFSGCHEANVIKSDGKRIKFTNELCIAAITYVQQEQNIETNQLNTFRKTLIKQALKKWAGKCDTDSFLECHLAKFLRKAFREKTMTSLQWSDVKEVANNIK